SGQPTERLVVGGQPEAELIGRVGEGADVDAVAPKPLDDSRHVVVARQAEEGRAAHSREARSAEQAVQALAIAFEARRRPVAPSQASPRSARRPISSAGPETAHGPSS